MQVNLSRIHNMLKQLAADVRDRHSQAMRPLAGGSGTFSFRIFEGTSDSDIAAFMDKLKNKKQQTEGLFQITRQIMSYCGYLRRQLDAANREKGVADKLLELGILQKETANLAKIRDTMEMSCSEDFDPVKGVDYYKTSFTDTQKTYELSVKLFSEKDISSMEKEIEEREKAANALKDEIAFLNQTTVIEILSFEEFAQNRF